MIVTPEVTPELREEVRRVRTLPRETLLAMVEPDEFYGSVSEARLVESGRPVWAIIGDLSNVVDRVSSDIDPAAIAYSAEGYMMPVAEVVAAIAYYEAHRCAIDSRLADNRAALEAMSRRGRPVGV